LDNQEVETVDAQTSAASEPVSHRDDVHNDVAAAIAKLKTEAAEPKDDTEPVKDDHPEPVVERQRGPDGKFVKAEAAPEKAAPEPETSAPDAEPKPIAQPSTAAVEAPSRWAPDAKVLFKDLPPAVQAAVAKAEAEMNEGGRQWSEQKRRYEQVLSPLVQETQRLGISPEQGLNSLLSAHRMLNQNPAAAIAQLAQQYGVDLQNLASNPPAPQSQPQYDPTVLQLTQTVSALEGRLSGFLQSQTENVVNQFAQSNPHWDAVEADLLNIVPIMQQMNPHLPPAEILQKAYDQAIWTNPAVREKLLSEQQAKSQKAQTDAIAEKAAKAGKAAVSIKGSSNGASAQPKQQQAPADETPYDTVRRTLRELRQAM